MFKHIQQIHQRSRKSYGAPRMHAALKQKGFQVGRHRVARLMRQQGICVRSKRRFKSTTDSNHPFAIAENRLERNYYEDTVLTCQDTVLEVKP